MRPACILALVILAATSFASAKTTTTMLPQVMGTLQHRPFLEPSHTVWSRSDLESSCGQTTQTNLSFRRGFMEFSIPAFVDSGVSKATLIITDLNLGGGFPTPPPDVHEVSFYAADLAIDLSDYDAPTTLMGTLEASNDGLVPHEFAFDVTEIVRQFEEGNVGFRIKLQVDPIGCPSSRSAEFGNPWFFPPRLVIETKKGHHARVLTR